MPAKKIQKDVDAMVKEAIANVAYEIAFEIQHHYETCIDAFYSSYTPRVYHRDYNLYLASSAAENISSEIHISDKHFSTGIYVSHSYIGAPYVDPTDYVFNRSYFWGIHGTIKTGGIMIVPPERLMDIWFQDFKKHIGDYIKKYLKI